MGALWKRIQVYGHSNSEIQRAKCFSSRSKECLLDIDINLSLPPKDKDRYVCALRARYEQSNGLRALLDCLPPVFRWRSFSFSSKSQWDFQLLFSILDHPAPSLRTLILNAPGNDSTSRTGIMPSFGIFEDSTPMLSKATIRGVQLPGIVGILHNLQEMSLYTANDHTQARLDECLEVLRKSPHLKKLTFHGGVDIWRIDPLDDETKPLVQLHHLEDLSVGGYLPATLAYVLSSLDVPNITSLTLTKLWRKDYNAALKALTPAAYPKVRNLALLSCVIQPHLCDIIAQLPAVQQLTFDYWNNPVQDLLLSGSAAECQPWQNVQRLRLSRPLNINNQLIETIQKRHAMKLGPSELVLEVDENTLEWWDPMVVMELRDLVALRFIAKTADDEAAPHDEDGHDMRTW
ncbi:hypothetical protein CALVIDRAFT_562074 [Calocera viscosa TUFC12733]|uniref:F-box domain-containing protein n=1 Tax=Calocera viscosa (strain TUFC12733) TaxID=1330018 RepID=A0A167PC23_CALVF|nr:hypothetical protein CALVIDRAFT_562074 [Calocera viscosa TUFC12733]